METAVDREEDYLSRRLEPFALGGYATPSGLEAVAAKGTEYTMRRSEGVMIDYISHFSLNGVLFQAAARSYRLTAPRRS